MSVKVYDHRQYGFRAGVSVCLYHQPVENQEWMDFEAACIREYTDIPRCAYRLILAWRAVAGGA